MKSTKSSDKSEDRGIVKLELSIDDPLSSALTLVDRKIRSLEKRRLKAASLRHLANEGKVLNADQLGTVSQYDGIIMRIECIKEMQETLTLMHDEYVKSKKGISGNFSDPVASARSDAVSCMVTTLDVLSNAQLYSEKLNIINSGNDAEPLSRHELNAVIKFKRLIDNSAKKTQFHYHNLVSHSDKIINKELNVTYAALMILIKRIYAKVQLNSISSKDVNPKKSETSSVSNHNGLNGVTSETNHKEKKNVVDVSPVEIIEIVEKTENLDLWQDYSRTGEKKSAKEKKNDRGIPQVNRSTRPPRVRMDTENSHNEETHRVTSEGTHIIVRDNHYRGRDENSRGYRGNRERGRRSDVVDGARPVNDDNARSSRDGPARITVRNGNMGRGRTRNTRDGRRGFDEFRGRSRYSQEHDVAAVY